MLIGIIKHVINKIKNLYKDALIKEDRVPTHKITRNRTKEHKLPDSAVVKKIYIINNKFRSVHHLRNLQWSSRLFGVTTFWPLLKTICKASYGSLKAIY